MALSKSGWRGPAAWGLGLASKAWRAAWPPLGSRCACGCGAAPGLVSLKGCGGRGCGAEHAAHTAVGAVPIARNREPLQPAAAATAAGPRCTRGRGCSWPSWRSCRAPAGPQCADGARPGERGCCTRRRRILLVLNPSIILGSKHPHFPGEYNTEYNTENNSFSRYRV